MNPTNLANANHALSNIRPVARRFGWTILIVCLLVMYLLLNFVFPGSTSGNLNLYVLQPVLWLTIAFLSIWLWSVEGERVNLFEKIKIPEALEAIRVIRIHLGDEMTAGVGRAKIAKAKLSSSSASGEARAQSLRLPPSRTPIG